jgi:hypothetical protein
MMDDAAVVAAIFAIVAGFGFGYMFGFTKGVEFTLKRWEEDKKASE